MVRVRLGLLAGLRLTLCRVVVTLGLFMIRIGSLGGSCLVSNWVLVRVEAMMLLGAVGSLSLIRRLVILVGACDVPPAMQVRWILRLLMVVRVLIVLGMVCGLMQMILLRLSSRMLRLVVR